MKSDLLDVQLVTEATACLKAAAGEIEHTVDLLEGKLSPEDLASYKRMVGKIIIALYSGLADPLFEAFPKEKAAFYGEDQPDGGLR